METSLNVIEQFFRNFERQSNGSNPDELFAQFGDAVMVAGPDGSRVVRASDLAVALPKRKELFNRIGCRSTRLLSMQETRIDQRYVMAETQWCLTFERGEGRIDDIHVGSTFILDCGTDEVKIVFYLTHQDIMKILRERGILPS
jgi:hypothetical protein